MMKKLFAAAVAATLAFLCSTLPGALAFGSSAPPASASRFATRIGSALAAAAPVDEADVETAAAVPVGDVTDGPKNNLDQTKQKRVPAPRVIQRLDPASFSPLDVAYFTGASIYLSKFTFYHSLAFSVVDSLGDDGPRSWNERIESFVQGTKQLPLLLALLDQGRETRVVSSQVQTVRRHPSTGELQVIPEALQKANMERLAFLIQEDLGNVKLWIYPLPSEIRLDSKETIGPLALPSFLRDSVRGLGFTNAYYSGHANYETKSEQQQRTARFEELAGGIDVPEYYVDFHSVPGGFLSPEHCAIYDLLSDTILVGTARMARRMAIRPIVEHAQRLGRPTGKGMNLLDLGTGTGVFLNQVCEALVDVELQGLDVSPAMLNQAKKSFADHPVMKRRRQQPILERANMEAIPRADASMDIVTQANCFHEMPQAAIRGAVAEIARVLKPGGLFVHNDSLQMQDDPAIARVSQATFSDKFNEPFLFDWMTKMDLDVICEEFGLEPTAPPRVHVASTVRSYHRKVE